jgi:crotonobetainyl-CoA:carnitine CoA-transferase CaiB-like acyl-CoA transferase
MLGALDGVRVLDLTRLAPGPYCSMLLADMGADVVLVEPMSEAIADTPENRRHAAHFALGRNKRSVCIDLKTERGLAAFLSLAAKADVLLEGFRPGVAERLEIGYPRLSAENSRLVYCSLSGYGQTGPYAQLAGHDLNYISIGGALGMIGRPETRPAIPMNFLADYAGGGLMAAFGIASALFRREKSGAGQYIDVAMSDGALSLATKLAGQFFETGVVPEPGAHRINGGAPYYDVYACKDGRFLAVGALEPKFFQNLCRALDLEAIDQNAGPELARALSAKFLARTRDEWFAALRDADACVTPVYALDEALKDPHNVARGMVAEIEGVPTLGVVPKLHGTPGSLRRPAPLAGEHAAEVLGEAGYLESEIQALIGDRIVAR